MSLYSRDLLLLHGTGSALFRLCLDGKESTIDAAYKIWHSSLAEHSTSRHKVPYVIRLKYIFDSALYFSLRCHVLGPPYGDRAVHTSPVQPFQMS